MNEDFSTHVILKKLGIEVYQTGETIVIQQGNSEVTFPKDEAQTVIDGILVVDWGINRRRQTRGIMTRRGKPN